MNILLISPSLENHFENPKPPLGLLYIASAFYKNGFQVKIIDMNAEKIYWKGLKEKIKDIKPNIIAFSSTTPYFKSVCYLSEQIKKISPEVKIIIGGPHVSSLPFKTLHDCPYIDIGVVGEGELTMMELIKILYHNYGVYTVNGIVYRDNNVIKLNEKRSLITNLDTILFPLWDSLNMPLYINNSGLFNKKVFPIITTRGCPSHCTFCDSHKIWQRKVRVRSINNIMDEINILKSKYNVNHIIILDDTFTINKKRVNQFCEAIKPLRITWECNGRANSLNEETLINMKKSGCVFISYGFETANQAILDYVKKGISLSDIRKITYLTKKANIRAGGFWMIGFPQDNYETIKNTVSLIKELNLHWNSELSILIPYPGSDIYYDMQSKGLIISENYEQYFKVPPNSNIEPPIKTEYLSSKELLTLKKKYDLEIYNHTLRNIILYHLSRPDQLLKAFISNPLSCITIFKTLINRRNKF